MTFELLLLLIGTAGAIVLLRACDPFGVDAIRKGAVPGAFLTKRHQKH